MRLIISILIVPLFLSSALYAHDLSEPSPEDDEALKGLDIYLGYLASSYCALITTYNVVRFHSGNPTGIGGVVGTVSGLIQTGLGTAILFSEDGNTRLGAGMAAVGAFTTYYGIRNILAVRRKHLDEKEKGLTVTPLIGPDSRGSSFYGIRIDYTF